MGHSFYSTFLFLVLGLFLLINSSYSTPFYSIEDKVETVSVTTDSDNGNIVILTPDPQPFQVKVYDLTGQEVFSKGIEANISRLVIDAFILKKGLYFIHVILNDGNPPLLFKVLHQ